MYKHLACYVCISLLIVGCKITPNTRAIQDSEISNNINNISDYKSGDYLGLWVQPTNKSEKCEILIESYPLEKTNPSNNPEIEWDGKCKNGKAEGLGKISSTIGSTNHYEITYHNKGITEQLFYQWTEGLNQVHYGSYVRENNRMVKRLGNSATVNTNGDIDFIYSMTEENLVTGISKGIGMIKYSDGLVKYTGELGNLLFFGTRESFDVNNKPNFTLWGYYDVHSNKPEGYVAIQNSQGVWHQYYKYGNLQENIQLPTSYINNIMKVSTEAAKAANLAGNVGNLALAMKKKYDSLNSSNVVKPKKLAKENPKAISTSTGTGFIISNDGFILTNSHVIEGASKISVMFNGQQIPAKLVDHDSNNDIALLKVEKKTKGLAIELKKKIKQGAEIAVLGYPNIGLQGNEQKATFGEINANSGIQGDPRYFQISSPIQPGNSGSPLVNENGVVIGIASASLNQSAAIQATGTLAQNVNYAVKIAYALPMLINHGVSYHEAKTQKTLEKTALIENIADSVVLILAN